MRVTSFVSTVENGRIKLPDEVHLPEHARVYVLVPGIEDVSRFQVGSPRLAQPERAADFTKEVSEEPQESPDASLQ